MPNYRTEVNKKEDAELFSATQWLVENGYLNNPISRYKITKFALYLLRDMVKLNLFSDLKKLKGDLIAKSSKTNGQV